MQRFLKFKAAAADDDDGDDEEEEEEDVGFALSGVAEGLINSASFVKFIQAITGCSLTHSRHAVRRFRPGLDYTVAHFGAISSDETLDMSLCFIGGGDAAWDDGELGGFECYMPADDASNARASAEVYTAEGDGVLSLSATFNSLNLVKRGANTLKFTKCSSPSPASTQPSSLERGARFTLPPPPPPSPCRYISCLAPASRWDISAEFLISK